MNKEVRSYSEHFRQDSKLIWAAILMVGFLTGGITDIVEVFRPPLDDIFVSEEEIKEVHKTNNSVKEELDKLKNEFDNGFVELKTEIDSIKELFNIINERNRGVVPIDPQSGTVTPRVVPRTST